MRQEYVEFSDGTYVWVRGLTTLQWAGLRERSQRRDPRGGTDETAALLIQIVMSCFEGEEPEAKRVFSDLDLDKAGALPAEQTLAIMAAIQRVNGMAATEQEILRDFTAAQAQTSSR